MTSPQDNSIAPRFSHQSLHSTNAIRILHLDAADDLDAPVIGTLEEHEFNPAKSHIPEYLAVSYVWGSTEPSNLRDVFIRISGGQLHRVTVTSNCYNFLRHVRQQHRSVWVDAICIDQNSNADKSIQVALMKDIYYHAPRVVIWFQLGEGTGLTNKEDVEHLFAHFRRLVWLYRMGLIKCGNRGVDIPGSLLRSYMYIKGLKLAGVLRSFLSNDYFHRVWTVQESVLPRLKVMDFMTSEGVWPFRLQILALNIMMHTSNVGERDDDNLAFQTNLLARGLFWKPQSMLSYLNVSSYRLLSSKGPDYGWYNFYIRNMRASEPRDRVYAFLWQIEDDKKTQTLEPDYTRPVAQVFADFSRILIQKYGLELTYYAFSKIQREGLPTWSPDWEYKPSFAEFWFIHNRGLTEGHSGRAVKFVGNKMYAQGSVVDTISHAFQFEYEEVPQHEIEASSYGEYLIVKQNIGAAMVHIARIFKAMAELPPGKEKRKQFHDVMTLGGLVPWKSPTAFERDAYKNIAPDDFDVEIATLRWTWLEYFTQRFELAPSDSQMTQEEREKWFWYLLKGLRLIVGDERGLDILRKQNKKDIEPAEFVFRLLMEIDDKVPLCKAIALCCFSVYTRSRVLFFTSAGRMGSSLAGNVGDALVEWKDHSKHVILRKLPGTPDGDKVYNLISLAYSSVDLDSDARDQRQLETFEIL